ncbi:MAG TPA: ATP-binding protein [Planctomycetota bacterium]|nr:ATP-binding protein [Planctomycetota bacterium]
MQEALSFGSGFLADYAGSIIKDPHVAIVELVANSYDAGSTRVEVDLPTELGRDLVVRDNGTGMTTAEFKARWNMIGYQRLEVQGSSVEFPPDVKGLTRVAFGRNGKGRLSGFCFANSYTVVTTKAGEKTTAEVRQLSDSEKPYYGDVTAVGQADGHGTTISLTMTRNLLAEEDVRDLLGTKFLIDPSFTIIINGREVKLLDLEALESLPLKIPGHGEAVVHLVDGQRYDSDRRVRLRGITWWVNRRMVGIPNWEGLDGEGNYLDGRKTAAKRFAFIIKADFLKDDVKPDWTGFFANARIQAVQEAAHALVVKEINRITAASRKQAKIEALRDHGEVIDRLPVMSREVVGQFVDMVQEKCPSLSPADLSRTAGILAKLEAARYGYEMLDILNRCSPDDLDTWYEVMARWSAGTAKLVLDELGKRLGLIEKLRSLVNDPKADELHDLQPLFERGLWIFGPEYEAVDFRSNRSMSTVVQQFFDAKKTSMPSRRPDIVAMTNGTLGVYAAEDFSDRGEVCGYRKVLVVELKKGGFQVTQQELYQGNDYSQELRRVGKISAKTEVIAYVLGSSLADGLTEMNQGGITVRPLRYDTLLDRAHSRTFQLKRRIEEQQPSAAKDAEVEQVVEQGVQDLMTFEKPNLDRRADQP